MSKEAIDKDSSAVEDVFNLSTAPAEAPKRTGCRPYRKSSFQRLPWVAELLVWSQS